MSTGSIYKTCARYSFKLLDLFCGEGLAVEVELKKESHLPSRSSLQSWY